MAKWFSSKVQPLFFDVIPTKGRQRPQYGLLGLWGLSSGKMFSSLENEISIEFMYFFFLSSFSKRNFKELSTFQRSPTPGLCNSSISILHVMIFAPPQKNSKEACLYETVRMTDAIILKKTLIYKNTLQLYPDCGAMMFNDARSNNGNVGSFECRQ